MLSDVAHEIDGAKLEQPLRVVDHPRRGRSAEIEEPLELRSDRRRVGGHDGVIRERSFLRLAARIADETGPAADQGDRAMASALEVNQPHHRHETADVEARRRRVEPDVRRHLTAVERAADLLGVLKEQIPPFELVEQRLRSHGTKLDEVGLKVLRK